MKLTLSERRPPASFWPSDYLDNGLTVSQLKDAGFRAGQLLADRRITYEALKEAGFEDTMLEIAERAIHWKEVGTTALSMKDNLLYGAMELSDIGYNLKELKEAGFSAKELKEAEFTVKELLDGGFTAQQLKAAGFTAGEF